MTAPVRTGNPLLEDPEAEARRRRARGVGQLSQAYGKGAAQSDIPNSAAPNPEQDYDLLQRTTHGTPSTPPPSAGIGISVTRTRHFEPYTPLKTMSPSNVPQGILKSIVSGYSAKVKKGKK